MYLRNSKQAREAGQEWAEQEDLDERGHWGHNL